jgi:NADH-quinone oxidoreductase subunit A
MGSGVKDGVGRGATDDGGSVSGSLAGVAVWPAALYAALVLLLAGLILLLSHLLGERQRHAPDTEQYESGIKPAGPMPRRLSVEFYQVALFFVIFDLEAVFIFSWAVAARRLGWSGYLELLVFVLLLFAGLVYLWLAGGLDWGAAGRRRRAARAAAHAAPARAASGAVQGGAAGPGDSSGGAP